MLAAFTGRTDVMRAIFDTGSNVDFLDQRDNVSARCDFVGVRVENGQISIL